MVIFFSTITLNAVSKNVTIEIDNRVIFNNNNFSDKKWTLTEVISTESTSESKYPSLITDSVGNVHLVWQDHTNYMGAGTDFDIFYKRWDAFSSSWTATEVVSTESTGDSESLSLAVDSVGNAYIAWQDYTGSGNYILYKKWLVSSASWTVTEVVSTESLGLSYYPSLAVDSEDNIHIAWFDYTDYLGSGTDSDIFYKFWNTSSSSWTITEVVSTESTDYSLLPVLAVDITGNIYIAWTDMTNYLGAGSDFDIFYKYFNTIDSSWSSTEVVSTGSTGDSLYSSIAVDSIGNVHIAWEDNTDYTKILCRSWDSSSLSWMVTEEISPETEDPISPSITTDYQGDVHIAWESYDDYGGSEYDSDIFYKKLIGPPVAPELAFIIPNPTEISSIYLNWNNVTKATEYYVYRSTSYIWSVESLFPITSVSVSNYIDTVPSEGVFYYVIVANNVAGNSTHSNCQYVEIIAPELDVPELSFILPNPTETDVVSLVWDSIDDATEYYIYRSDSYIWSVEGLTPIATEISTTYIDTLPDEGFYFYVIVATDGIRNSTHSNCEHLQYKLPSLSEFTIVSSLILGSVVILFAIIRIRKKNNKLN